MKKLVFRIICILIFACDALFALMVLSNPALVQGEGDFSRRVLFSLVTAFRPLLLAAQLLFAYKRAGEIIGGKGGGFAGEGENAASEADTRKAAPAEKLKLLSNREIEVARLASFGLTNAAIGEQLFISEPTVKRHLANIFDKLGITSRKELRGLF